MKFSDLVHLVADEPVFETGLLLVGDVDAINLRRQLSRWTRNGRLLQLRRGLYALAPPWQKRRPHPFLVANRLAPGSYVSSHSALAHWQAIPEFIAEVTSCAGGRPRRYHTPLGRFGFSHLTPDRRFGYRRVALGDNQHALLAEPEKALLDLVYFVPDGDNPAYLKELRLDYDVLNLDRLKAFADQSRSPKLIRTAAQLQKLAAKVPAYEVL